MTRSVALRSALAVGVLAFAATGCGRIVEKAAEKAVEQAVENETGENVDINFDDNGIQVDSGDGSFTLNADENGVQIDGSDGEGGDFSLDSDADGNFTASDGDGNVATGQVNGDDGTFTVNGEDGESVFTSGAGVPAEWPSDIPQPSGLSDVQGTYAANAGDESFFVVGNVSGSVQDAFDDYVAALSDAGFTEQSKFTSDGVSSATYISGGRSVNVSSQTGDDASQLIVSVTATG